MSPATCVSSVLTAAPSVTLKANAVVRTSVTFNCLPVQHSLKDTAHLVHASLLYFYAVPENTVKDFTYIQYNGISQG